MTTKTADIEDKVALVTGAARRIGAEIVRTLHGAGMRIVLHYRGSAAEARALQEELNAARPGSAALLQADLGRVDDFDALISESCAHWGRLDALVNNASGFYPTPIGSVTADQWQDLMDSNLRAPFFLSQAASRHLAAHGGCIVNITDIHAERPLKGYPVYSIAKAGLSMMTRALARELGPAVRVNAVAPGAILWPEHDTGPETQRQILDHIALKRQGDPADIARAVLFLLRDAPYVTGHTLAVDGGRSLYT